MGWDGPHPRNYHPLPPVTRIAARKDMEQIGMELRRKRMAARRLSNEEKLDWAIKLGVTWRAK